MTATERTLIVILGATGDLTARKLLPAEYNENPAIFPTEETLSRCEPEIYTGEASLRLRDEAWTRILAA